LAVLAAARDKGNDDSLPPSPAYHHKIQNLNTGNTDTSKMKFSVFSILAFVVVALAATQPQKSIIITYPDNTPDSIVEQAKNAVIAAGGMVTHEYKLIK
jgi:hypothetical protein